MKIKWTVQCEWDCDIDSIYSDTKHYIENFPNADENELRFIIKYIVDDLRAKEDDIVYYSFGKKQLEEIVQKIFERLSEESII